MLCLTYVKTLSLFFLCPLKVLKTETWCLIEGMTKGGGTLGGRIGQLLSMEASVRKVECLSP